MRRTRIWMWMVCVLVVAPALALCRREPQRVQVFRQRVRNTCWCFLEAPEKPIPVAIESDHAPARPPFESETPTETRLMGESEWTTVLGKD
jgi:hypothetical protein